MARPDVRVEAAETAWTILIPKAPALVCEITVPMDWCFEWFVSVKRREQKDAVWSDWMEYYGGPDEVLDAQMADGIVGFVDRAVRSDLSIPISLHEERA